MTDGENILQITNLYTLAIDAKQWHLFDLVFTEDVHADYSGRTWSSLKEWKEEFEEVHRVYDVTQHLMGNVNWHTSGDTGSAVSQVHFHLIRRGFPGGDAVCGCAWYDDVLRNTVDGWRIAKRICRVSWISGNAGLLPGFDGAAYPLLSMSEGADDGTLSFVRIPGFSGR